MTLLVVEPDSSEPYVRTAAFLGKGNSFGVSNYKLIYGQDKYHGERYKRYIKGGQGRGCVCRLACSPYPLPCYLEVGAVWARPLHILGTANETCEVITILIAWINHRKHYNPPWPEYL